MNQAYEAAAWEARYSGNSERVKGVQPWDIGEPQPAISALIEAGEISGTVLDAGCGHAQASLRLAELGHTVVGLDFAPTAIAAASASALERGLSARATYTVADITEFTGFNGRFDTIIDSALFHALPVESRDRYLASILRAAAPGANYIALVFDKHSFDWLPEGVQAPNVVDEPELREAVSKHWAVDEIRPALIHANLSPERFIGPLEGVTIPEAKRDEKGRLTYSAWLLLAHKAA